MTDKETADLIARWSARFKHEEDFVRQIVEDVARVARRRDDEAAARWTIEKLLHACSRHETSSVTSNYLASLLAPGSVLDRLDGVMEQEPKGSP